MSPLLYPFFNSVFVSHCANTFPPAHTALCKLFKHSSRRAQTSSSAQTSHRDTGHSRRPNDSSSANCNHTGSGDVVGGREEGEGFIRAGKARQDLLCRLCAVQGCPALPHGTGMESQAPVWGMGTTCPMSTPYPTPCPSRATHVATPAWMLCFN